jgi:hypothetical protein
MYQHDDFDDIQCEEYYVEEPKDQHDRNNRRHSKQSHLTREAISKLRSSYLRKAKEKARSAKRMLRERLRSKQLGDGDPAARKREDNFNSDSE